VNEAFVTDTHPLLWLRAGATRKLGRAARKVFAAYQEGSVDLYVPGAVVLETWFLAKNGTIQLSTTLDEWWGRILNDRLHLEPLTADDVFAAANLDWDHRDVHDRLIVATAQRLGLRLVTADEAIHAWGGIEVLW
jgi:PIN domain nuclease of toxin-antitoxin system